MILLTLVREMASISNSKTETLLRVIGTMQSRWHARWCPEYRHFPEGIVREEHRALIRKGWYCISRGEADRSDENAQ